MSISPSPSFSGSSPAAPLSLSPLAEKHPACGRKKAALPLILFQVLAALFLFCGTVPASAQEGRCYDGITWKLDNGTLTLSGYDIMEENSCEWHNYPFSSVVINEGINSIADYTFFNLENLESVSIPASVEEISGDAFLICSNLKSLTIARNSKLKTIGSQAFMGCYKLESFTIPASVTNIGGAAFDYCSKLTLTIERGDKPLTLPENAFITLEAKSADLVYLGNDRGYFKITPNTGYSISGNTLTWEGETKEATLTWVSQPDGVPGSGEDTSGSSQGSFLFRCPDCRLPATGFSSRRPAVLSVQPMDVWYEPVHMRLQIPSLNVETDLVTVPLKDNDWQVEWLSGSAGILDGSALPGEGFSVIAAHNTLSDTEYGPFALLASLETNDLVTVADENGSLKLFRVYANLLLDPDDLETMAALAGQEENALALVTCENESEAGTYLNRRVVFAKPAL